MLFRKRQNRLRDVSFAEPLEPRQLLASTPLTAAVPADSATSSSTPDSAAVEPAANPSSSEPANVQTASEPSVEVASSTQASATLPATAAEETSTRQEESGDDTTEEASARSDKTTAGASVGSAVGNVVDVAASTAKTVTTVASSLGQAVIRTLPLGTDDRSDSRAAESEDASVTAASDDRQSGQEDAQDPPDLTEQSDVNQTAGIADTSRGVEAADAQEAEVVNVSSNVSLPVTPVAMKRPVVEQVDPSREQTPPSDKTDTSKSQVQRELIEEELPAFSEVEFVNNTSVDESLPALSTAPAPTTENLAAEPAAGQPNSKIPRVVAPAAVDVELPAGLAKRVELPAGLAKKDSLPKGLAKRAATDVVDAPQDESASTKAALAAPVAIKTQAVAEATSSQVAEARGAAETPSAADSEAADPAGSGNAKLANVSQVDDAPQNGIAAAASSTVVALPSEALEQQASTQQGSAIGSAMVVADVAVEKDASLNAGDHRKLAETTPAESFAPSIAAAKSDASALQPRTVVQDDATRVAEDIAKSTGEKATPTRASKSSAESGNLAQAAESHIAAASPTTNLLAADSSVAPHAADLQPNDSSDPATVQAAPGESAKAEQIATAERTVGDAPTAAVESTTEGPIHLADQQLEETAASSLASSEAVVAFGDNTSVQVVQSEQGFATNRVAGGEAIHTADHIASVDQWESVYDVDVSGSAVTAEIREPVEDSAVFGETADVGLWAGNETSEPTPVELSRGESLVSNLQSSSEVFELETFVAVDVSMEVAATVPAAKWAAGEGVFVAAQNDSGVGDSVASASKAQAYTEVLEAVSSDGTGTAVESADVVDDGGAGTYVSRQHASFEGGEASESVRDAEPVVSSDWAIQAARNAMDPAGLLPGSGAFDVQVPTPPTLAAIIGGLAESRIESPNPLETDLLHEGQPSGRETSGAESLAGTLRASNPAVHHKISFSIQSDAPTDVGKADTASRYLNGEETDFSNVDGRGLDGNNAGGFYVHHESTHDLKEAKRADGVTPSAAAVDGGKVTTPPKPAATKVFRRVSAPISRVSPTEMPSSAAVVLGIFTPIWGRLKQRWSLDDKTQKHRTEGKP
ncbi:hypothetical protein EC9_13910 [Rosistilla ulvae]|uniref:Uncharacterized protein n=1 Tax=Rosistilla ulvae TaxID=1930277 RepID=A0A517LX64_9BACT|nr:hypothetical protein [Rosistilla ulvae]QDS87213.1 hypothetical protein EC9_13910 [Rosistilla ulvae]